MNILRQHARTISILLIAGLMNLGLATSATAAMVGTQPVATDNQTHVVAARANVAHQLVALGVSHEDAATRVADLTDAEALQLSAGIDSSPAGGNIVNTVVFVALVLLVTDIVGWTDVYPFVRK